MKTNRCKFANSRTFMNMFEEFNCFDCPNYHKEEQYKIGETFVNIYHINNECINDRYNHKTIANSKRLRLFLKDAYCNQKEILFLWEDSFDIDKRANDLYNLLMFEKDIHIICL